VNVVGRIHYLLGKAAFQNHLSQSRQDAKFRQENHLESRRFCLGRRLLIGA
jgi:hypothetical protein